MTSYRDESETVFTQENLDKFTKPQYVEEDRVDFDRGSYTESLSFCDKGIGKQEVKLFCVRHPRTEKIVKKRRFLTTKSREVLTIRGILLV